MKINARNSKQFNEHIELICYFAGDVDFFEGLKIFEKLRRYENRQHKFNEDQCNFDIPENEIEKKELKLLKSLQDLLPGCKTLFINGDPRGYALKYEQSEVEKLRKSSFNSYQDWGGYGILAPEF